MPYLDTLVPVEPDPADLLERLQHRRLTDNGATVRLGPLDEATLNLIRYVLSNSERNLVLALPQGRHDVAVALGVLLQLNRLGRRLRGQYSGEGFEGPVMVIGRNVNLTDRLRRIKIGPEDLSTALHAQRVRTDGTVTDLRGAVSPAVSWSEGLLYLNTSLGWPTLPQVQPGLVIIDRTSFRNPDTLQAALVWAKAHEARRIIVLSTIGEPWEPTTEDAHRWIRWGWTPGLRRDVGDELGRPRGRDPLSTNALLCIPHHPVMLAEYQTPALSQLRRSCLSAIAEARRSSRPLPPRIAEAAQLLNVLTGTWSSLAALDVQTALEPRGSTTTTLRRSLRDRRDGEFPPEWSGFRETKWPDLRRDVLSLADLLEDHNPRLDLLRELLAWAQAARPGARLIVRTRTGAAARALTQDLVASDPGLESLLTSDAGTPDLRIAPYSERLPWAIEPTIEFHLGVPPPWQHACLLGGESTEHVLAVDPDEKRWANRVLANLDQEWQATLQASAAELNLDSPVGPHVAPPHTAYGPVMIDSRGASEDEANVPAFDLDRVLGAADALLATVDHGEQDLGSDTHARPGSRQVLARCLVLAPGDAQYWLPLDGSAEILIGNRYSSAPVSALTAGTTLLIPRGESRDQLYSRLLQAAHRDADVAAVTTVLQRFREATQALHDKFGSWAEAARALRGVGSEVQSGQTCRNWAEGRVIAPDDAYDIRRVAWLTHREDLTSDRTWARIGAIADELRRLHRSLGRFLSGAIAEVATGRSGANLDMLSDLCGGIDPAEVLEEFELRKILSVGATRTVQASELCKLINTI